MCTSPGGVSHPASVIMSLCLQASPWCMAMTHASGGHCPRAAGQQGRRWRRPWVVGAATGAAETRPVCMCSCCSLACVAQQEARRALHLLQSACEQAHRVQCCAQDSPVPGDKRKVPRQHPVATQAGLPLLPPRPQQGVLLPMQAASSRRLRHWRQAGRTREGPAAEE